MHSRNSPNVPKNNAQESSEKTITDIHQQPSEEIDDTVKDTTYKMPPPRHDDESESDDEKSLKKKEDVQKSATVPVEGPKSIQSMPKPVEGDTKPKKILQSRMSPSGFVDMIDNFNEAQKKAIQDMGFGGFLHLQVTELPGDLCKWLVDRFNPYSSPDKRIEITLIDVHLTLALPIGGRKLRSFIGRSQKTPNIMKSLMHGEKIEIWKMGPLS
ncbi:hypothetical protein Cgig2_014203 [Carnegiea gigantea]|uniref:Uncharacterized protein n=1 Tax=Carnegiea gigantea TaxID=171969 RepID=A0A9Q1JS47_9CARY|nr:hypothetical protein Cgig2_014203 [Carnegiea gigantea]